MDKLTSSLLSSHSNTEIGTGLLCTPGTTQSIGYIILHIKYRSYWNNNIIIAYTNDYQTWEKVDKIKIYIYKEVNKIYV